MLARIQLRREPLQRILDESLAMRSRKPTRGSKNCVLLASVLMCRCSVNREAVCQEHQKDIKRTRTWA